MEEFWNNWTLQRGSAPPLQPGLNSRVPQQRKGTTGLEGLLVEGIKKLHGQQRNAETVDRQVVVASGKAQLIAALCYGLAMSGDAVLLPLQVYERPPHQVRLKMQVDASWAVWETDLALLQETRAVELLATPSSPLGDVVLSGLVSNSSHRRVIDMSSNWKSLTTMPQLLTDEELVVFDLAEASGHASLGFAWALVKDPAVASKAAEFLTLSSSSSAVSPLTIQRATQVLSTLADHQCDFFSVIRETLSRRWDRLLPRFASSSRFSILSIPRSPFLVLRCLLPSDAADCTAPFLAVGIDALPGALYGLPPATVSLSLLSWSHAFDVFFVKISSLL